MNASRPVRLSLLLAITLGILAACDVSDSPARADAPTTTTFAPRILAPAGGVRQADWLHLQVWEQNGQTGNWDTLHSEVDLPPTRTTLQVKVPLRQKLRYRVAGYVVSFPNGTRQVDTVWSAEETDFIIYDTNAVQRNSGTVARNWAISPTISYADSVEFRPGNELVIPSPAGQRLAWSRTSSAVSCSTALPQNTSLKITPLVETSLRLWVRSCSVDPTVLPSSIRSYQWKVDTIGIGAQNTPLAPIASGVSGFADLGRILAIENDPLQPLSFVIPATSILAWNMKLSSDSTSPEASDFPMAPAGAQASDAHDTGTTMNLWTDALKDFVAQSPSGLRVAVSLVRIDTSLGQSWVSPATRFWFRLSPPPAPSRFELSATRWDSVRIDWSLTRTDLTYRAWRAPGTATVDPARAIELTSNLDSSTWFLGGLPPDSALSILLEVRDPRTGLVRREQRSVRTNPLPLLPSPFMVTPNTFGAKIKASMLGTVRVAKMTDSADRPLHYSWGFSSSSVATTTDPTSMPWPEIPAVGALVSTTGTLSPTGSAGQYIFLTVVTEDDQGHRSAPLKYLLEVVADDVEVDPDAPIGLRVKARAEDSITFAWTNTPGYKVRLRYDKNRLGTTEVDMLDTDSTYTVTGLKAGDSLVEVAVRAIDLSRPGRMSAYSQPSLSLRTRIPPSVPTKARARWLEDAEGLRLQITWEHVAETADQLAWEGISSELMVPGAPQWRQPSAGIARLDSLEIPYANLPKTPFLAIGVRAIRDSIVGTPVWTPLRIPALAPAIADRNPRIWQRGDTLWIELNRAGVDTAFTAKVRVQQFDGPDVTLDITSDLFGMDLGGFASGKVAGALWWERKSVLGTAFFDRGPSVVLAKDILPAPQKFSFRVGESEKEWFFSAPTDLAVGAQTLLVKDAPSGRTAELVASGHLLATSPESQDTFRVAQVLAGDTSRLSGPRWASRIASLPIPSPVPGSYLFQFPIALSAPVATGTVQVRHSSSEWKDYAEPFNPHHMSSPQARIVGPFSVSAERPLDYSQDSTFDSRDWEGRVKTAGKSGWIITQNSGVAYDGGSITGGGASLKIAQLDATSPGILNFSVDPIRGSTMDLSTAQGISMRYAKGTLTGKVVIAVTVSLKDSIFSIDLPTTVATTGDMFSASFTKTATGGVPTTWPNGQAVEIPWADLPALLTRVKSVGLVVYGDLGRTSASLSLTSVSVVPKARN